MYKKSFVSKIKKIEKFVTTDLPVYIKFWERRKGGEGVVEHLAFLNKLLEEGNQKLCHQKTQKQ